MKITRAPRPQGLGIDRYLALLLLCLTLLFAASFFYYMNLAREISVAGTRIYGAYLPLITALQQQENQRREFWRALETALRSGEPAALDATVAAINADLAAESATRRRRWRAAQEAAQRLVRLRRAAATAQGEDAERARQADRALDDLLAAVSNLEPTASPTEAMRAQLPRTANLAHGFENRLLTGFALLGAGLAGLFGLLHLHLARPLRAIMTYLNQMGTGAARRAPPPSRIRELRNITAALENLGTYLSNATVQSQKLVSEHDRFQKISLTDGLTGIHNRRAFDAGLRQCWAEARENRTPLGLIMLDVDKFKTYNDSYGHQAGDVCLVRVAAAMARTARATDLCARYGGEEFALLLPGANAATLQAVTRRVHAEVAAERLPHPASPCGAFVTVSMGAASLIPPPDAPDGGSALVRQADAALYAAKEQGRNRSVVHGEARRRTRRRKGRRAPVFRPPQIRQRHGRRKKPAEKGGSSEPPSPENPRSGLPQLLPEALQLVASARASLMPVRPAAASA